MRRMVLGFLLGALCAFLLWSLDSLGFLRSIERSHIDGLFRARGVVHPSPKIVIVAADDTTITRYPWPLPRQVYADLIDHLTQAGAHSIVLDVLIASPSNNEVQDKNLIQSTQNSGRVLNAMVFNFDYANDPSVSVGLPGNAHTLLPRFALKGPLLPASDTVWGTAALPALQLASVGMGHLNAPPEEDGVLRRIPHILQYRGGKQPKMYPSLALAAATRTLNLTPADIQVSRQEIVLPAKDGTRRIPLDSYGRTWVNWIGPHRSFPTYSFNNVLDGEVPDSLFKDKVVLVGITAMGSFERHATPFSGVQPAVELQANALDDILMNRPLRAASHLTWLMLLLVVPALTGALTLASSVKINGPATLITIGVLQACGLVCLAHYNLVLPVATPALAAVAAWSTCLGYRQFLDAAELRLAEERYSLAVRGANDGLWDWDLISGEVFYSPRWAQILGLSPEDVSPTFDGWYSRVHPQDQKHLKAQVDAHIAGGSLHLESQHKMLHADGTYLWVLVRGLRVCGANGRATRMAGSLTDVTQQVTASQQLEQNAFYDKLTGLPNRALFVEVLGRAMVRQHGPQQNRFAVLSLDLDRFKVVNDSLGHAIGDALLVQVAQRLKTCLRPQDLPARLGGDEFTILVDEIEEVGVVTSLADRIQEELARPFLVGEQEIFPTCSIGIAFSSARYNRPEDMLRDADTAMYRAKTVGRARYAIFDEEMHEDVMALLVLETDLRRGLERNAFQVYYQPIVDLRDHTILGFEALVRWNHPQRGLLAPGEFIALAEETGLIILIDRLVLAAATEQLNRWRVQWPELHLSISVNLSSKQFSQGDLVPHIQSVVRDKRFRSEYLKLEITEGALLENSETVATQMAQLREIGVKLSLDDFGTGYSSLSYLHRFPIDTLKIDQSFIKRLGEGGKDQEIVNTIVALAHKLNMDVTAEGVESQEQLDLLRGLQCDYGQGYLFSFPVTSEAATELLRLQQQKVRTA